MSMGHNKYLILIAIALSSGIVLAGCGTTRTINQGNTNSTVKDSAVTNTTAVENVNTTNQNSTAEVTTNTSTEENDITWLTQPLPLGDLDLFNNSQGSNILYYQIASLPDGGKLILQAEETLGFSISRLRSDANGNYYLLQKYSPGYNAKEINDIYVSKVSLDTTTDYPALDYVNTISLNNLKLIRTYSMNGNTFFNVSFYENGSTMSHPKTGIVKEFSATELGSVYEYDNAITGPNTKNMFSSKQYFLMLADTSIIAYKNDVSFLADDGSLKASLTTEGSNFASKQFSPGVLVGGCGLQGADQVVSGLDSSNLVKIGDSADGPLYTITNKNNSLLKEAYAVYTIGHDSPNSTVKIISYDEFVSAEPVLIWQNALGDNIVYMDQNYAPMVECGKPVIYLYPTRNTEVSVQVAATITKSEPLYQNGWNVLAQPDGTLMTNSGSVYSSLFWEGKGNGLYPTIASGRVVKQSEVEAAIRQDLATLGLNSQETQDFLDFWMPRMPRTSYVRLSWLDTPAMNQLAPLTITPQPDTILRVFLDFAGQATKQTNLKPQILHSTPRHGFTAVEWGGLLVGE